MSKFIITRIFVTLRATPPYIVYVMPVDGRGPLARVHVMRCNVFRLRSSESKKCYIRTDGPEGRTDRT